MRPNYLTFMIVLLSQSLTLNGCATYSNTDKAEVQQPKAEQHWSGRVYITEDMGVALADGNVHFTVLRNEKGFAAFVKRIPTKNIQKRRPAPPSSDPFVQGLKIDFSKHMLLVSFRTDNMYIKAPITGLHHHDGKLTAHIEVPPIGDTAMMAAQLDIGTYYALLAPQSSGTITPTIGAH
jgi:hypothetical protein